MVYQKFVQHTQSSHRLGLNVDVHTRHTVVGARLSFLVTWPFHRHCGMLRPSFLPCLTTSQLQKKKDFGGLIAPQKERSEKVKKRNETYQIFFRLEKMSLAWRNRVRRVLSDAGETVVRATKRLGTDIKTQMASTRMWLSNRQKQQKKLLRECHQRAFLEQQAGASLTSGNADESEKRRAPISVKVEWSASVEVNTDLFLKHIQDAIASQLLAWDTAKKKKRLEFVLLNKDGSSIHLFELAFFKEARTDFNNAITWEAFKTNVFYAYLKETADSLASVVKEIDLHKKIKLAFKQLAEESTSTENVTYGRLYARLLSLSLFPVADKFWDMECWGEVHKATAVTEATFAKHVIGLAKPLDKLVQLRKELEEHTRHRVDKSHLPLSKQKVLKKQGQEPEPDQDQDHEGDSAQLDEKDTRDDTAPTDAPSFAPLAKSTSSALAREQRTLRLLRVCLPTAGAQLVLSYEQSGPRTKRLLRDLMVLYRKAEACADELVVARRLYTWVVVLVANKRALEAVAVLRASQALDEVSKTLASCAASVADAVAKLARKQASAALKKALDLAEAAQVVAANAHAAANARYVKLKADLEKEQRAMAAVEALLRAVYRTCLSKAEGAAALITGPGAGRTALTVAPTLTSIRAFAQQILAVPKKDSEDAVSGLPSSVDHSRHLFEIQSQLPGQTGFLCAMKTLKEWQHWTRTRRAERVSLAFLAAAVNEYNPDVEGQSLVDALHIASAAGVATDSFFDAYLADPSLSHTVQGKAKLKVHVAESAIDRFASLADVDSVKAALVQHGPVFLTLPVYDNIEPETFWRRGTVVLGYHTLLAVGYNDAEKQIVLRNSFGTSWGEMGSSSLSYAELESGLASQQFQAVFALDKPSGADHALVQYANPALDHTAAVELLRTD